MRRSASISALDDGNHAYLEPILARYIANLEQSLADVRIKTPQKYIMQSNGGMATFAAMSEEGGSRPCGGPAGGITASVQSAAPRG